MTATPEVLVDRPKRAGELERSCEDLSPAGVTKSRATFRPGFLAILLAFTVSTLPITICAAPADSESVIIVIHVDIIPDAYKPLSEENAVRLLRSEAAATKHDAGLISIVLLKENGLGNHFTILQTWSNIRSYEMHQGADHTFEFRKDIQQFIGSPFDARENRPVR